VAAVEAHICVLLELAQVALVVAELAQTIISAEAHPQQQERSTQVVVAVEEHLVTVNPEVQGL
jgi:hypothetical protein